MTRPSLATALRYLLGRGTRAAGPEIGDGALLEQFTASRDQHAFAELVRRHGPMVLGVCRRVTGNEQDAEDAFQAAFLVLARRAGALRGDRALGSWLYTVARNLALNARLRAQRRRDHERQVSSMQPDEPAEQLAWREAANQLDAELGRLPEKYRAALVLCYLQGKTHQEAANELGWPAGSIAKRLARGCELLRERLGNRGLAVPVALLGGLLQEKTAAAVSAPLFDATVQAAVQFTTAPATSGVPALLAEGVLQAMYRTKVKMIVAASLALAVVAGAGGLVLHRVLTGNSALEPAALAAPLPGGEDPKGTGSVEHYFLGAVPSVRTFAHDLPDKVPLLTIGTRPPMDARAEAEGELRAIVDGKLPLRGPAAGKKGERVPPIVQAIFQSPVLNSGNESGPIELTRKGDIFTLTVRTWTDTAARTRNVPWRRACGLSLGSLEAGNYELRVICQSMVWECDRAQPDRQNYAWYQMKGAQQATVKFTVTAGAGAETPVTLQEDQLKDGKVPEDAKDLFWQLPTAESYRLQLVNKGVPRRGLQVGAFDLAKPANLADLPALSAPAAATDPVYAAVLGPQLNIGEAMTLRSIRWKDREATLVVDVWRDDGPRLQNIVTQPLLVVPLLLPARAGGRPAPALPGEYKVRVEWTPLRSPRILGPYMVEKPSEQIKALSSMAPGTVTIK